MTSHELNSGEAKLRGELQRSIRKGDLERLRGLVLRGAPLQAAFDLGYGEKGNPVDLACISGLPEVALELLRLADQCGVGDALAVGAHAAFFWCVTQGYTEVLRELLDRGADIGRRLSHGYLGTTGSTALELAVFGLRKAETLELLRHGAWEKESAEKQKELMTMMRSRKQITAAFKEAGIYEFEDVEYARAAHAMPFKKFGILTAVGGSGSTQTMLPPIR